MIERMGSKKGIPPIPPEEIGRLLESSAPTIHRHGAIIHLENDSVFSGVYAKSFGYEGILTAGHCASDFLAAKRVALPVSELMHQLWVETNAFEHVPIGYDETEGYTPDGPDLSFVIIRDEKLLRTIKRQNYEFYDLDHHRARVREVFTTDMHNLNWSVAGNPGEKVKVTKQVVNGQWHKFVDTTAALIQGNLAGYELRGDFDYVMLLLGSGFEEFPASYKGVNGGGIWYQQFVATDGKTYKVEPMLAGVACWQGERTVKKDYKVRTVTGHGWVSIYGHVRRALAEKRASEPTC
jgi:hypothetical protein